MLTTASQHEIFKIASKILDPLNSNRPDVLENLVKQLAQIVEGNQKSTAARLGEYFRDNVFQGTKGMNKNDE